MSYSSAICSVFPLFAVLYSVFVNTISIFISCGIATVHLAVNLLASGAVNMIRLLCGSGQEYM